MAESISMTWGDFGQEITIDGIVYLTKYETDTFTTRGNGTITIHFKGVEPVNQCDKCHRAEWREIVADSWSEAIERKLLIPKSEVHSTPGMCPACSHEKDKNVPCRHRAMATSAD